MTSPETMKPSATSPVFLPAIVSGSLLFTAFFPLSQGWVAWFAFVPFLTLIRARARPRRLYFAAFVGGLAFYLPAIQWMRVAHPAMYATWIGLALYCSVFFPLGLWLIRVQDRARIPLYLAVPAVWVGFEYFRMHFPSGFAWMEPLEMVHRIGFGWYFLGYSQHDFLTIIQIADLTGVYGVSFLVVVVNLTIFLWWHYRQDRSLPRPIRATALTLLLVAASLGYGIFQRNHEPFTDGPRVALLQGNVAQDVKMTQATFLTDRYVDLWMKATVEAEVAPDLTIFPETSIADDWIEKGPGFTAPNLPGFYGRGTDDRKVPFVLWMKRVDQKNLEFLHSGRYLGIQAVGGGIVSDSARRTLFWRPLQKPVLFGLTCIELNENHKELKYNSALLMTDLQRPIGRYDKMHLVPFGEYVPLKNLLPFLSHFAPYPGDYSCTPGTRWTRFPVRVHDKVFQFGCIICYEDSDPALARRYAMPALEGPPVDFLVNISNDGWFDGTPEHEEHLAICRFRAVETRRSIVRAVNMGISAIIDADGRVIQIPADSWRASKKMEAVVTGIVPIDHRSSLYAVVGDALPLLCWLATATGLALAWVRRRRQ